MLWMRNLLARAKMDQKAQGMVEYALIIAFVVGIGVTLLTVRPEMKEAVGNVYDHAAEVMRSF